MKEKKEERKKSFIYKISQNENKMKKEDKEEENCAHHIPCIALVDE